MPAVRQSAKPSTRASTRAATRADGRAYGADESRRTSSRLQLDMANRCLLVLSLLDQRADFPDPTMRLSHPVIAEGINRFADIHSIQSHTTISRLLRAHRRWTPDLVLPLCRWAADAFELAVDPGWVTYGAACNVEPPEVPADCVLRPDCVLSDGAMLSARTIRQIRTAERARKRR